MFGWQGRLPGGNPKRAGAWVRNDEDGMSETWQIRLFIGVPPVSRAIKKHVVDVWVKTSFLVSHKKGGLMQQTATVVGTGR